MKIRDLSDLEGILQDPGTEFRSLPFWGWNDRLEEGELRRQLRDMREKGIGGCFSHARDGIETPYLSDEWMHATRVMADEAAALGMQAWIYDEDKWPSGSAGGKVAALDPDAFTAKGLTLEVRNAESFETDEASGRIIEAYEARIEGKRVTAIGEGGARIILRREISGPSEWYNGSAPADNMNAAAVRAFIDLTHERYKTEFNGSLKGKIKGFFTDEPNVYDFFAAYTPGRPWLPWTDDFPAEFERRRGYGIGGKLYLLFFDGAGRAKIRHDYWRTVTELFSERYMKQIYDWCEANAQSFTGHILYENDLGYNIRVCGAAMPHYRYLHAPGIDLLGEQTREYLTVRQCASAARQYGRDMVISETYGATGWEFDFAGQKWLGDWQYVMGVNRRCMHMALYSIAGCRKRDYPPVFNYQNTWYPYARRMEDYFARLSACLSTGECVRNILVIHPISSLWTLCGSDPEEDLNNIEMNQGWRDPQFTDLNRMGDEYNRLTEILTRAHFDHDFGDEIILEENAKVCGDTFIVGHCAYRAVIVPRVLSLFRNTLELLQTFEANGGKILWVGEAPEMTEGAQSDLGRAVYALPGVLHAGYYDELPELLHGLFPDELRVWDRTGGNAGDVLTMLRRVGEDMILFAVNHDRTAAHEVRMRVPMNGGVTAYDAWNDTSRAVEAVSDGHSTIFVDTIEPNGSLVYFIRADRTIRNGQLQYSYVHPHYTENLFAALGPTTRVRRTAPNALTLDMCSYRLAGSPCSERMEVWQAQRRIRDVLGMQQVYANGIPQRYVWLEDACRAGGTAFEMSFEFDVDDVPEAPVYAAVEKPRGLNVRLNGEDARLTDRWYMDRAIAMFELPKLRPGRNRLALSGMYTADRELEDVFLLGDFAVTSDGHIARETGKIRFGDWCLQGYRHYSGALVYSFDVADEVPKGERIRLKMGAYAGVLADIIVNGVSAGVFFGECVREIDITQYMKERDNTIEISVMGTPRNLMGPLHRAYAGCSRISWADFRTEGNLYSADVVLHPYGLMGQIALLRE